MKIVSKFLMLALLFTSLDSFGHDISFQSKYRIEFWHLTPLRGDKGDTHEALKLMKNGRDVVGAGYRIAANFVHHDYVNGNPVGGSSNNSTTIKPVPGSLLIAHSKNGWTQCSLGKYGNTFYTAKGALGTPSLACNEQNT